MKKLFDQSSFSISKKVTHVYSTSFSLACRLLSSKIRPAIYAIYGFVRYADEIVDSFHEYEQEELLHEFEKNYYLAYKRGISLNPVLHSFQSVVKEYGIDDHLIQAFLKSMKTDLNKKEYFTYEEFKEYIYGSADVVGLMCLKVFVNGDDQAYERLKPTAMRLGSAFQKVNFLRDIKDDMSRLERSYFPNIDFKNLEPESKQAIIEEIEADFDFAYEGIKQLPIESRLGVYTAYRYYRKLLSKLKKTEASRIMKTRIRVSDPVKFIILGKSMLRHQFNLL
jgi:phytoene/squalene synthetase